MSSESRKRPKLEIPASRVVVSHCGAGMHALIFMLERCIQVGDGDDQKFESSMDVLACVYVSRAHLYQLATSIADHLKDVNDTEEKISAPDSNQIEKAN